VNWSAQKAKNFASDKIFQGFFNVRYIVRHGNCFYRTRSASVISLIWKQRLFFAALDQPRIIIMRNNFKRVKVRIAVSVPNGQTQPSAYCLLR